MNRTVRFGETDAAGVLHFHNLLRWCHEAWEESLQSYGIDPGEVFPNGNQSSEIIEVALPIIHCNADFRAPIKTGESLEIHLLPEKIGIGSFQVQSKFKRLGDIVAIGLIKHLAINSHTRERCPLPENINLWLEASCVNLGPRPL